MNEIPTGMLSVEILRTLHAVEDGLDAALAPLGLSLAKLGVLSKLVAAGEPLALGELAKRSACVRSNITQLVDRLEADKLVARSDDPNDRRSVRAELTDEGRARHAAGIAALKVAEASLLERLPGPHRASLLPLLQSLRGV